METIKSNNSSSTRVQPLAHQLRHIKQDKDSNCGQTCVAMLTGKSIKKVEEWMNRYGRTKTHDIVFALREHGYDVPFMQLTRCIGDWASGFPYMCIIKMTWKDLTKGSNDSHWIVKRGNEVYDPAQDDVMSWMTYYNMFRNCPTKMRPTSYLEVIDAR